MYSDKQQFHVRFNVTVHHTDQSVIVLLLILEVVVRTCQFKLLLTGKEFTRMNARFASLPLRRHTYQRIE